jgi:hypothetical protein
MTEVEVDWHLDFIAYIVERCVPEDKVEREKIVKHATNYVVISTELYRRSASSGIIMKRILRPKVSSSYRKSTVGNAVTTRPPQT